MGAYYRKRSVSGIGMAGGIMAKNDQQEAFEKLLSSVLGRVVDFLRFAEAKNAALLTFSSAWILASTTLLTGSALNEDWLRSDEKRRPSLESCPNV